MKIDIERLATDLDYWNSVSGMGRTYYDKESGFFCDERGYYTKHGFRPWSVINPGRDEPGRFIPRPTTPAWSGEGLPPVGCECEFECSGRENKTFEDIGCRTVKIIAHDMCGEEKAPIAVFSWVDAENKKRFNGVVAGWFRPIRTPEQIQRDELARLIGETVSMRKTFGEMADALVKAGYHK